MSLPSSNKRELLKVRTEIYCTNGKDNVGHGLLYLLTKFVYQKSSNWNIFSYFECNEEEEFVATDNLLHYQLLPQCLKKLICGQLFHFWIILTTMQQLR